MTGDSLLDLDWSGVVERLGGADALGRSGRATGAFQRGRVIKDPVTLLRLILAYCIGDRGLRLTAAWASAIGLADVSNVALLYRLQRCTDWLTALVGEVLAAAAPAASRGRLIRLIDATAVPKAGAAAGRRNQVWRIHSAFDLPGERFGHFELTDQQGGERLDRIPVIAGEIRIADRAYMQPDRMAKVIAAGADIVVRAGWRSVRWQNADATRFDLMACLRHAHAGAHAGLIDCPVWLGRKEGEALPLRLVAVRKPELAAQAARRQARRNAQREGYTLSADALAAADWVLIVTSLPLGEHSTADVLALYRLRWRIELGFKRLKSLVGLKGPPGQTEASAKAYVLAHLLVLLLLEPLVDALEDSPRWALAA